MGKKEKPEKIKKVKKKTEEKIIPSLIGTGEDYHIYTLNIQERISGIALGFLVGIVIGYVFFNHLLFACLIGVIAAVKMQKPYKNFLHERRLKRLLQEFKDLMETLSASYSAGFTNAKAFADAQNEMQDLYGSDSDIVKELQIINAGLLHSFNLEDLLLNFAARSGLDDINSFANVFEVCNRKGGDLKKIVGETRGIINDKMEMEMEMKTMVAAAKNELNIMMVMPLIIMMSMRGFGDTMTGNSFMNIAVKLIALAIFVAAYWLGNKLVDIKL